MEQTEQITRMIKKGISYVVIAEKLKLSPATIIQVIKEQEAYRQWLGIMPDTHRQIIRNLAAYCDHLHRRAIRHYAEFLKQNTPRAEDEP